MTQPTTSSAPTDRPTVWSQLQPLLLAVAATARQRRTGARFLTVCVGLLQALGRSTLSQVLQVWAGASATGAPPTGSSASGGLTSPQAAAPCWGGFWR